MKRKIINSVVFVLIVLLSLGGGILYTRLADRYRRTEYPALFREEIEAASEEFGVPSAAVYAVIHTLSGFEPGYSAEGAAGLYPLTEEHYTALAERAGESTDPRLRYCPEVSIRLCALDLSLVFPRFEDRTQLFAALLCGPETVERSVAANGGRLDLALFGEQITSQTEKIVKAYEKYISLYPADSGEAESQEINNHGS